MFTKLASCYSVISSQISSHLSKYSQFERMGVMFFPILSAFQKTFLCKSCCIIYLLFVFSVLHL